MELLAYEHPDFALTEALETDPIVMRELVEGHPWPYPLARARAAPAGPPGSRGNVV